MTTPTPEQPKAGVQTVKAKDGREVQQARVNVSMFDGIKKMDDQSVVDNLVHSHAAVDSHNAELQAAMAAVHGEEVPNLDAPKDDVNADAFEGPDGVVDPNHEANLQDAMQHVGEEESRADAAPPASNIEDDMARDLNAQEEPPAQPAESAKSQAAVLLEIERRERDLRDQRLLLAKERKDMEQQSGQSKAQLDQLIAGLRQSPQAALAVVQQITGYSYQDIAKGVLSANEGNPAPVGPPGGQPNPTEQQIAQLTQQVQALTGMLQAKPQVDRFDADVKDLLAKPEYALLNDLRNPLGIAQNYATGYMQKYGVGLEALSPKEIVDTMLAARRDELDSLKASAATLQYLGAGQSGDAPTHDNPVPANPPRPTLTSGEDEAPSRGNGAQAPETHEDVVRAALNAIPQGARRGFN